ncbi:hypothetical protein BDQ17DRAFT_1271190 [Cyathus striatus]|nr:hypothetical protein BDQ17DRAFT_1271190 [Cyathus striatus]
MSFKTVLLALVYLSASSVALPIRREVPQEHSHEQFLTAVRASLNLNNPAKIQDPVFALLGNTAAAAGAGNIADVNCLQQAVADQAFTNAKAAGDVDGMVSALIFRALERNSGKVGLASDPCTSIEAVNPEIAAIQQHQDPASSNAAAVNKAIALELAKQIAAVGGDPQLAIKSGTFAPGNLNDTTAKGNTCDDQGDATGCIFTQNLLVPDVTADEITAAVDAVNAGGAAASDDRSSTVTVTATPIAAAATQAPAATTAAPAAVTAVPASTGSNLQKFSGALGGQTAPAVTTGARGFQVEGSDSFLNEAAAVGRSCDIQHNKCANFANSAAGRSAGLTVSQCDQQDTQCRAAN